MRSFNAVVVGAGAAGLFCAGIAGQRGLKVLLIDAEAEALHGRLNAAQLLCLQAQTQLEASASALPRASARRRSPRGRRPRARR